MKTQLKQACETEEEIERKVYSPRSFDRDGRKDNGQKWECMKGLKDKGFFSIEDADRHVSGCLTNRQRATVPASR